MQPLSTVRLLDASLSFFHRAGADAALGARTVLNEGDFAQGAVELELAGLEAKLARQLALTAQEVDDAVLDILA